MEHTPRETCSNIALRQLLHGGVYQSAQGHQVGSPAWHVWDLLLPCQSLRITFWVAHLLGFYTLALIHTVLLRLQTMPADLLLVAPFWPNQPWFPLLLRSLGDLPFLFPLVLNTLSIPCKCQPQTRQAFSASSSGRETDKHRF